MEKEIKSIRKKNTVWKVVLFEIILVSSVLLAIKISDFVRRENVKKETTNTIAREAREKRWHKVRANYDTEYKILLSVKYNLDKDKIYNLINEYNLLVFGSSEDSDYKPRKNEEIIDISDALVSLSKKYSVPKEAIANIILDKRLLECSSSE